jgi:hypothetical protein
MSPHSRSGMLGVIGLLVVWGLSGPSVAAAAVWHVGTGDRVADANPGTAERPVASVMKAVSLAKPGDMVVFSSGAYPCSAVRVPDGSPDAAIILRSDGKGKVIFTNDGSGDQLILGSYNTIDGIEFQMLADRPRGHGIRVARKEKSTRSSGTAASSPARWAWMRRARTISRSRTARWPIPGRMGFTSTVREGERAGIGIRRTNVAGSRCGTATCTTRAGTPRAPKGMGSRPTGRWSIW